nr:MAG TPA: hypothetical protein [Caudoviricetes sp.]
MANILAEWHNILPQISSKMYHIRSKRKEKRPGIKILGVSLWGG